MNEYIVASEKCGTLFVGGLHEALGEWLRLRQMLSGLDKLFLDELGAPIEERDYSFG